MKDTKDDAGQAINREHPNGVSDIVRGEINLNLDDRHDADGTAEQERSIPAQGDSVQIDQYADLSLRPIKQEHLEWNWEYIKEGSDRIVRHFSSTGKSFPGETEGSVNSTKVHPDVGDSTTRGTNDQLSVTSDAMRLTPRTAIARLQHEQIGTPTKDAGLQGPVQIDPVQIRRHNETNKCQTEEPPTVTNPTRNLLVIDGIANIGLSFVGTGMLDNLNIIG